MYLMTEKELKMKKGKVIRALFIIMIFIQIARPITLAANASSLQDGSVDAERMEEQTRASSFIKKTWTGADNQKVIQAARAQLGQTAVTLGYTEPWCADFVCDIARITGISNSIIPWGQGYYSANVGGMAFRLEQYGAQEVALENAKPGDLVIFNWSRAKDAVRLPTNEEPMDHVAFVIFYDPETKYLHYIGGNQNPKEALEAGISYPSRKRHVTEVVMDTEKEPYVTRVYRPKYASADYSTPIYQRKVTLIADGNGTVSGEDNYMPGTTVKVKAVPGDGMIFTGWYWEKELVSKSAEYTFEVKEHITLTAKFMKGASVTAKATPSGSVTGGGNYRLKDTVTFTATPQTGKSFEGWYLPTGEKVSVNNPYVFTAEKGITLTALFSGDYFIDVPAGVWYREYAVQAGQQGIVRGNGSEVIFDGNGSFTRAMAVTMIARMAGADVTAAPRSPFSDAPAGAWFTPYVNWAYANSVTAGMSATSFAPGRVITRQEFITMLERYIEAQGISIAPARTPFHDMGDTAGWAKTAVERFYARGLVKGDNHGNLLPQKVLSRSEGTAFIMRTAEYLKSHGR